MCCVVLLNVVGWSDGGVALNNKHKTHQNFILIIHGLSFELGRMKTNQKAHSTIIINPKRESLSFFLLHRAHYSTHDWWNYVGFFPLHHCLFFFHHLLFFLLVLLRFILKLESLVSKAHQDEDNEPIEIPNSHLLIYLKRWRRQRRWRWWSFTPSNDEPFKWNEEILKIFSRVRKKEREIERENYSITHNFCTNIHHRQIVMSIVEGIVEMLLRWWRRGKVYFRALEQ